VTDQLFTLPDEHAHVTSADWAESNHCKCGLYRCSVLVERDNEPEAVWPTR